MRSSIAEPNRELFRARLAGGDFTTAGDNVLAFWARWGPTLKCPADIAPACGDNAVNISDLLAVISAWGPCAECPTDLNRDGMVNTSDLTAVINAWGACP